VWPHVAGGQLTDRFKAPVTMSAIAAGSDEQPGSKKRRTGSHPPKPRGTPDLVPGSSPSHVSSRGSDGGKSCASSRRTQAGRQPQGEIFALDSKEAVKQSQMPLSELVAKIWRESYSPGRELRGARASAMVLFLGISVRRAMSFPFPIADGFLQNDSNNLISGRICVDARSAFVAISPCPCWLAKFAPTLDDVHS
jgi:hypothetical protein